MNVIITQMQRFSVNDGPGIRTTCFFKGCPLECRWCHNPETQMPFPEVFFKENFCKLCEACVAACPQQAVTLVREHAVINRLKCTLCMKCVDACKYGAIETTGKSYTTEEIIQYVLRDQVFHARSGGGMTISGGEPYYQPGAVAELAVMAKERGIHLVVDTCGHTDWTNLEKTASNIDLFLYDIKHIDEEKHRNFTGISNRMSLENAARLTQIHDGVVARVPIIPGFNDSAEELGEIMKFIETCRFTRIDLLPFHNFATAKYAWLNKNYLYANQNSISKEYAEEQYLPMFQNKGYEIGIGG